MYDKRMTLLMLLVTTMAMRATAENWPITIAGVNVNDQNAATIMSYLGNAITPYDPSESYSLKVEKNDDGYTLTLENVKLETSTEDAIKIVSKDSVTIWCKGLNYIQGDEYGIWSQTFSSGLLIAGDSYSGCIVKGGEIGIYQRGKYLQTYTVALEVQGDKAAMEGDTGFNETELHLGAKYENFHIRAYATQECVYGFKSISFFSKH